MRRLLPVVLLALALPATASAQERFPRGFLWGTATSGFQTEAGGPASSSDRRSDWWAWSRDPGLIREGVVSGDRVDRGPGSWTRFRDDFDLVSRRLNGNAVRFGIEWSRVFPRRTPRVGRTVTRAELRALDRVADQRAVRRYREMLRAARARGLDVLLTLNHFSLPIWVHDPVRVRRAFAGRGPNDPLPADLPPAGWLDPGTVEDFRTWAAYAAYRFGDLVDRWATLNEPLVQVSQGYVTIPGVLEGGKPPGVHSFRAAVLAVRHMAEGNAAAYDALKAGSRRRAPVGVVTNLLDWRPEDPAKALDVRGARNASQVFNRLFLDAAVRGVYDLDADGVVDPGERRPGARGKADFVGVNYYSPARAQGLGAPATPLVPLFDFVPKQVYRGTGNPEGPPCPSGATCTDFGWEIDPSGLTNVLKLAGSYGRPVIVTENGIDDADDDQRPAYLLGHLRAVRRAIAQGVDVRGYFHWSLTDNLEWAEGYEARFGLFRFDPRTLRRTARARSVALFARVAEANALP